MTQPLEDQQKYEQDKLAQLEKPRLELVPERPRGDSFFERFPRNLLPRLIHRDLGSLTISECKALALAGRPGISEFFQVAIGGAHFSATKLLDRVRRGESAKANKMMEEDPGLLDIEGVKFCKIFLHMLRGESAEADKMRKEDPDLLPDEEVKISQFLVHVSTENLEEAEKMLVEDPSLLFKKGRLVDFGLRRFTEASKEGEPRGLYAFQYAEAAEDPNGPMQRLLRRHCPEDRQAELEKQLEESRSEKDNKNYKALENARHSLVAMRDAMVEFVKFLEPVNGLKKYEAKKQELEAAWRVVVEKQLALVSCWIHLWTEKGEKVAWHDLSKGGARQCQSMSLKISCCGTTTSGLLRLMETSCIGERSATSSSGLAAS